ncbi:MAG: BrnT family toxin [Clostridia bacterium]|nr:BrnT family toxin [Clostridia bacterium]
MDRKQYKSYRQTRQDGDPYFPERTSHAEERFEVRERHFVWDKAKNEANIAEHGIDFYTAAYVFNDDFRLEDDNRFVDGELREQAIGEPAPPTDPAHPIRTDHATPRAVIGEVEGILFVVYVLQSDEAGDVTRIISARAANKREAKAYLSVRYADYLE